MVHEYYFNFHFGMNAELITEFFKRLTLCLCTCSTSSVLLGTYMYMLYMYQYSVPVDSKAGLEEDQKSVGTSNAG